MMAKRSHKRPPRCEKGRSGCMWSLIGILDFRQGRSPRRLLSDRRHGSARHAAGAEYSNSIDLPGNGNVKCEDPYTCGGNLSDGDESQISRVESTPISIKALIVEEMSKLPHSNKQCSIACADFTSINQKQINKTCEVACDQQSPDFGVPENLQSRTSMQMHLNDINRTDSSHTKEMASYIAYNEHDKPEMQLDTKEEILQESEEIEQSLIQKLINANQISGDELLNHTKEFMDALEILNLNGEVVLKLLQDPNSVLVRRIKELRNEEGVDVLKDDDCDSTKCGKTISHKQSKKQHIQSLFGRRDMARGKKENDGSHASNRIVVLKLDNASIQNSTPTTSPSSSPHSSFSLRNREETELVSSHFSLRDIKRKWKRATGINGKEQNWISMDGILHRIPYGHQELGEANKKLQSTASFLGERKPKTSTSFKKKDKRSKPKECELSCKDVTLPTSDSQSNTRTIVNSHRREANIYDEAKKHLAEMLNTRHENGDFLPKQMPRTLGRILSLPEYMSPRTSPRKDEENSSLAEQIEFSSNETFRGDDENEKPFEDNHIYHSSNSRLNEESSTHDCCKNRDGEVKLINTSSGLLELLPPDTNIQDSLCINSDLSKKGGREIEENVVCIGKSVLKDIPIEPDDNWPISNSHKSTDLAKDCGEGSSKCFRMESYEEDRQQFESLSASFSGSPLHFCRIEDPDSIGEKLERPSPVSVLDPFYVEDILVNRSPPSSLDELPVRPWKIHFEENIAPACSKTLDSDIHPRSYPWKRESEFEYVKSILEASGLSSKQFIPRWHSLDQLINSSLFEEVAASFTELSNAQKLLFDYVNEILTEVCERVFQSCPWVSFFKLNFQPIPTGKYVTEEVWKDIDWRLIEQVPCTLEQIVGKDMAKSRSWMDLRVDVEGIGIMIEEIILEELLEEITNELLD